MLAKSDNRFAKNDHQFDEHLLSAGIETSRLVCGGF